MKYFPIFLATQDRNILVSGGGAMAVAKLRVLLKTEARIKVFAINAAKDIQVWAREGRLTLLARALNAEDIIDASLLYAASDKTEDNERSAALAHAGKLLVNVVDNLEASTFITPAIVDRDPVTIAIGTEGTAPVLARAIKTELEERLPATLGLLAKAAKAFRPFSKRILTGRKHREFWADYYAETGPRTVENDGVGALPFALHKLLIRHEAAAPAPGHVDLVGAGPGDPDLLTLKARKALDRADIVIHDQLVAPEILELVRREATMIKAGKKGFGPATPQHEINELMIAHAREGAHVVRLKSGDPAVFGRLDEEIEALENAAIDWRIIPGITAASAAISQIGQSFTKRGRNSSIRFLTGHDIKGFAEHDWRALARPGEVAAIYMGKKSARFIQGRLMMNGAAPKTPVTLVENASRPGAHVYTTTLSGLAEAAKNLTGPAIILLGLAPRAVGQMAQNEIPDARPDLQPDLRESAL